MPIDQNAVVAYATELADAAGIPADQRPAFLANEKVLATARKRFEDIERETGRTKAEQEKAAKAEANAQKIYQDNLKIYQENKAAVEEAQRRVAAYETQFGPLDDASRRAAVQQETKDLMNKSTFDEEMKKRDGFTVSLMKDVSTITARHMLDFKEAPDFNAIEKIALEQGLSAAKAYEEWVRPKVEEKHKASSEAALKAAREEGFRDGQSKIAAGAVADSKDSSPFLSNLRKSTEVKTGPKDAFLSGWREAGAKQ